MAQLAISIRRTNIMKTPKIFAFSLITTIGLAWLQFPVHAAEPGGDGLSGLKQAVAVMHPTANNKCQGVVRFTQEGGGVKVVADLEGLNPGQKHAFHIHQYGDCSSADATSAGGHYNPEGHQHG